jgi:recombination protein RecA
MARVKVEEEIILPEKKTGGLYFSSPKMDVSFISSGCKTLDLALGGGWARRRIANVVGDKAVGKTLIMIEAAANFALIEPKGKIRYREAESAFDNNYAAALGFPVERVDFGEPIDTIEDVFEDLEKVLKGAKGPEIYIVDSLDSLSDRAEMDRKIDEGSYGMGKAKMLSQMFRRLVRDLANKDVTVFIVSQVRDNIGVTFGRKTTRSGGRALDFYASQVLFLSQLGRLDRTISNVKRVTGVKVRAQVDKNKIGLPYRECGFPIMFGYGIDDWKSCADYLKEVTGEIVPKATSLKELHKMVEDHWWEIERKFMPTESKYKCG